MAKRDTREMVDKAVAEELRGCVKAVTSSVLEVLEQALDQERQQHAAEVARLNAQVSELRAEVKRLRTVMKQIGGQVSDIA